MPPTLDVDDLFSRRLRTLISPAGRRAVGTGMDAALAAGNMLAALRRPICDLVLVLQLSGDAQVLGRQNVLDGDREMFFSIGEATVGGRHARLPLGEVRPHALDHGLNLSSQRPRRS